MINLRVSNGLDSDHGRRSVGPDLSQNCLQRLSADDKSRNKKGMCNPVHGAIDCQNAQKVTHIKGILLDQVVIKFNCVRFHNRNFS